MPQTHTPAPWTIDGLFDAETSVTILDAEGNTVCEVEPFTGEWTVGEVFKCRVIAAAPELLEALKGMIEKSITKCWFDRLNPCWDNRPTDRPGLHWGSTDENQVRACHICIARAAIAKAEGRQ